MVDPLTLAKAIHAATDGTLMMSDLRGSHYAKARREIGALLGLAGTPGINALTDAVRVTLGIPQTCRAEIDRRISWECSALLRAQTTEE